MNNGRGKIHCKSAFSSYLCIFVKKKLKKNIWSVDFSITLSQSFLYLSSNSALLIYIYICLSLENFILCTSISLIWNEAYSTCARLSMLDFSRSCFYLILSFFKCFQIHFFAFIWLLYLLLRKLSQWCNAFHNMSFFLFHSLSLSKSVMQLDGFCLQRCRRGHN